MKKAQSRAKLAAFKRAHFVGRCHGRLGAAAGGTTTRGAAGASVGEAGVGADVVFPVSYSTPADSPAALSSAAEPPGGGARSPVPRLALGENLDALLGDAEVSLISVEPGELTALSLEDSPGEFGQSLAGSSLDRAALKVALGGAGAGSARGAAPPAGDTEKPAEEKGWLDVFDAWFGRPAGWEAGQ